MKKIAAWAADLVRVIGGLLALLLMLIGLREAGKTIRDRLRRRQREE